MKGKVRLFSHSESQPYALLSYSNTGTNKKLPLIYLFHSAGKSERDYLDLWKETAQLHGFMLLSSSRENSHLISHSDLKAFYDLLDDVVREYPVDPQQIYIMGSSSGAYMAQWMMHHEPERWAGAIFLSSLDFDDWLQKVPIEQFPPVLFIQGKQDQSFPPEKIEEYAVIIHAYGGRAEIFVDENAGHEDRSQWGVKIMEWISKRRAILE